MTVNVRSFILSGAGRRPITQYSDSLKGVDDPPYMGQPWVPVLVPSAGGISGNLVDAQVNKSVAGVTYGGGGLIQPHMLFYPGVIDVPAVLAGSVARGVFSQAKLAASNPGTSVESGPAVMFRPNPDKAYILVASDTPVVNDTFLAQLQAGIVTFFVASTFTFAVGDVIRLECRKVGNDDVLKSYQNGVLRNTFTNVGAGPNGGLFGMCYYSDNVGFQTWTDYSGGLL